MTNATGASFDKNGKLHNGDIICDRVYSIQSMLDSSRYIDVTNALTADGSNVWTYSYNGAACQEWKITEATDATGEYMIMDMHSGKYLSIVASSAADGANAWIWHDDGTAGQRFHIENTYGTYKFLTKCSGYTKALAVDLSTHNVYQTDASSPRTYFYLEDSSVKYGIPSGSGYLQNSSSERFLAKSDSLITPNKIVQKNLDSYVASNKIEFIYLGAGYFRIDLNSTKCLTVKNNNVSSGIKADNFTGATGQLWKATVSLECIKLSPKCNENYYLSINSSDNSNNSELILSNTAGIYTMWNIFSTEDISDVTDLTFIGFSDESHSGCAGHLEWIDDAMSSMTSNMSKMKSAFIGYNDKTYMSDSQLTSAAEKSKLFFIRAHGNNDNGGIYMNLNSVTSSGGYYGSRVKYYYSDLPDMESCDCAFFFVCHSADGSYSNLNADNFLTYAVDTSNAFTAIGFDGSVYCDYGEAFADKFMYEIAAGETPQNAFKKAVEDLNVQAKQADTDLPVYISATHRIVYDKILGETVKDYRVREQ